MKTLLDVLEDSEAGVSERLEVSVVDAIKQLANLIETNSEWEDGRIESYKSGAEYFLKGLLNGSERSGGWLEGGIYHDLGLEIGIYSKSVADSALSAGHSKIEASYKGFISQLSTTARMLIQRLRHLRIAVKNPYWFIVNELKIAEEDVGIARSLAEILNPEKKLVEDIVHENLEPNFVNGLEFAGDEDSNMQLGVLYLFRDNLQKAYAHFMEAKSKTRDACLLPHIEIVADSITKANDMLKRAYTTIKSAMEFDKVYA